MAILFTRWTQIIQDYPIIYQRGPNNNMADSSAGLTVRLPGDWLNVIHDREYQLEGRAFVSDAAVSLVQMPIGSF